MGEGKNTKFQHDTWLESTPLKLKLPRLFSVSLQKDETVSNMRLWDGLFQWETEQFEALMGGLKELHLSQLPQVKAWWSRSGELSNQRVTQKGLTPPRAELLAWFILQGKLNTRDRLIRLNLLWANEASCPFCSSVEVLIRHLFLHCKFTWSLWTGMMGWWGIQLPITNTCEEWLDILCGTVDGSFRRKLWISLFYVVLWTIWNIRNRVVFWMVDWNHELQQIKLRLEFWMKCWESECPYRLGDPTLNLEGVSAWVKAPKQQTIKLSGNHHPRHLRCGNGMQTGLQKGSWDQRELEGFFGMIKVEPQLNLLHMPEY